MSTESNVDYSQIPVIEVARLLFGQESRERSSKVERHFPDHGALFVNIAKNRWFSHVNAKGGDAIELVRHEQGIDFNGALDWLGARGYVAGRRSSGSATSKPRQIVAEYDYVAAGSTLYQTVRYEPKDFRQRCPDGKGGWIWKGPEPGLAVPYRLPELLESGDAPVLIVGGEKDAENLIDLGFTATCNHGGEGKWWPELTPHFKDRRVFLLLDNDAAGEKHAEKVGGALAGVASEVRVVRFTELPNGGDVSDLIDQRREAGLDDRAIKRELSERFSTASTQNKIVKLITDTGYCLVVAARDFIRGFTPPDYLIDGVLRRRFAYSMTGRTGDGKTAVLLRIAAHVLLGLTLGKCKVERGRVLYLAGENPDDIRMRWMAMAHEMGFDPGIEGMHFIEGRFSIEQLFTRVVAEVNEIERGVDLVIVDTSATFFEFENENDNAQMARHARLLRSLTTLPGGPVMLAACHPTKSASDDNMLPRGGGAFLAEVDGNLTCIKRDSVAEVSWQGKFRGCDFAPISFQLANATAPELVDSQGRSIPTVLARPITEKIREEIVGKAVSDQDQVLILLNDFPGKSLAATAEALSWFYDNGDADKSRASRAANALRNDGMVKLERRGQWVLTPKGAAEAKRLKP